MDSNIRQKAWIPKPGHCDIPAREKMLHGDKKWNWIVITFWISSEAWEGPQRGPQAPCTLRRAMVTPSK